MGVTQGGHVSDLTAIDDGGPVETGFQLIASDPRRLGNVELLRRMRESSDPIEASDKPFPFLGVARGQGGGGRPPYLIVKVARLPVGDLAAHCLDEEETWARDTKRLYSAASDTRHRWVARSYIDGIPLNRLPDKVTDEQRAVYALWLLTEINAWHVKHGESHLDVKPSNVIVTDERAILIDFETSRDHGSPDAFNGLATASFASPEQVHHRADRPIGMPADVFSWGVTVFSLFSPGAHPYCAGPFDAAEFAALDERVARGELAPTPELRAIPSIQLREAVLRALAWQPERRPTADELIALLRADPKLIVTPVPTQVQPPVVPGPLPSDRLDQVRRWLSPAGPLGNRHLDAYVQLVAFVVAATGGLLAGLVLALIVGRVLGA